MNRYVFLIFLSLLLLNPQFIFAECWDSQEISQISGFSEVDDEIVLSFKDAVDCKPVTKATLLVSGKTFITDQQGYVKIPIEMFEDMDDKEIPVIIEKSGYITLETGLKVMLGSVWNKRFLLSKDLPLGKIRFVLQWGENPSDLDLHFLGSDFHVSYRNKKNVPNRARLDIDDTDGYGPETITVEKPEKNAEYRLFVHNYSGDEDIDDDAVVYVYANNRLDRVVRLPETTSRAVKVLDIRGNRFIYLNKAADKIR